RYRMSPPELSTHLASLSATRPLVWRFESMDDPGESKQRRKWQACMPWGNEVPYTAPHMQARGWHLVSVLLQIGIIWQLPAPFPHSIFALMEEEPEVAMLFDGPGSFEKLTYYLAHRETLHKRYKVRRTEQPLDYHFDEPDAGYSYRWEDGSLLPDGYLAGFLQYRAKRAIPEIGEGMVLEE